MTKSTTMQHLLLALAVVAGLSGWAFNPTPAAADWGGWKSRDGGIMEAPSCVSWGPNRIDCFARGGGGAMFQRWWDGAAWRGWVSLGGSLREGPTCLTRAVNHIDCVARFTDGRPRHLAWNGTAWSAWTPIGSTGILSPPHCIAGPANQIMCVAAGASDLMNYSRFNGTAWEPWQILSGQMSGAPTCVSASQSRVDCFARSFNGTLLRRSWNWASWNTWSNWADLGGTIREAPSCLSWGPDRIDCFTRNLAGGMDHIWWEGTTSGAWEPLGGVIMEPPSCVSWAPGRIDCFARGADGAMHQRWWDGSGWRGWVSLGGVITHAPSCTSWAPTRIDCFARGTDTAMHHRWYDEVSLTGYQIVSDSPHEILANGSLTRSVACPMHKIAIGGGYTVAPAPNAANPTAVERGVEVKGVLPVWPSAQTATSSHVEVSVRNANGHDSITLTAYAVCIDARPDTRILVRSDLVAGANNANHLGDKFAECSRDEVVIGGGAAITRDPILGWLKSNSTNDIRRRGWFSDVVHAGASFDLTSTTAAICASETRVFGWSIAESGPTSLSSHGTTTQTARCARGFALTGGIQDNTTLVGIHMAPVSLTPNRTAWASKLHNRDDFGAPASVVANTKAICADATP